MIEKLALILGSIGGLTAIMIWLAKFSIEKFADIAQKRIELDFAKDLEKYKQEINIAEKQFQSTIDKEIKEHELKFSKLHAERATLIKEIYILTYEMHQSIIVYTHLGQGPEWVHDDSKHNNAVNKMKEYKEKFERNRIFLDKETCILIENIVRNTEHFIDEMSSARFMEGLVKASIMPGDKRSDLVGNKENDPIEKWRTLYRTVEPSVSKIREDLADKFRLIIGVN
ncbi:MAG: hypothetical protein Q8R57_13695 [Bacteroidota bacterium]|nr:hypothetical protein [Bacteroidota bacterium]